MRPQVFASTVFVLLQRKTNPNHYFVPPLPPVGLKCFFNTIDVFTRYLKRGKSDTLKRHSLLVKHFCNSSYSLRNSVSNEIIFSSPHPSLRFKRCETYLPVQFRLKSGFFVSTVSWLFSIQGLQNAILGTVDMEEG